MTHDSTSRSVVPCVLVSVGVNAERLQKAAVLWHHVTAGAICKTAL